MKTALNFTVAFFVVGLLTISAALWYVKTAAMHEARLLFELPNENQTCFIQAFSVNYEKWGIPGTLVATVSGSGYFKIRNLEGDVLRNSALTIFQRDFPDFEGTQWLGDRALYATATGHGTWFIPECR